MEGSRQGNYRVIGNGKEDCGVVPATWFLVFLVGRPNMVGSTLPKRLLVFWLRLKFCRCSIVPRAGDKSFHCTGVYGLCRGEVC